jgi:hypothetical protein
VYLIEDLASGCERLGKNRVLGRKVSWHFTQVGLRQSQIFGKGTGMLDDPEDRAFRAMAA